MSTRITAVDVWRIDLPPPVPRSDAIQSFVLQETPMVRITCDDGSQGVGYSYTIGTGGSSVTALLHDHLASRLIGRDPACIEAIWRDLLFATHATSVGAITSLALAAIDTALWDWRCKRDAQPLWKAAGGAKQRTPVYTTEGGWLHLATETIVRETVAAKEAGFQGAKIKVGLPRVADDVARLRAVRQAVGDSFEIMVDANQCFTLSEALRRAAAYADLGIAWFEEPLPADDLTGHARLAASTPVPIAVGESLYSPSQFAAYIQQGACSIVQVDVARIGGITPWLKVAHLAECHNLMVAPHFLMELHASLTAAVPSAAWVEYIPQLDAVATSRLVIESGCAVVPEAPGLGIEWRWDEIERLAVSERRTNGGTTVSSDLSLLVAIATPLAGLGITFIWGRRRANARKVTTGGDALINAIGLGILLTIAQNFLLAGCVGLALCTNRGDAGLSYVFQSFFAIPVFWVAGLIAAKTKP